MKKKLFVDSDVILDLLAERPLFYEDAAKIFTWGYKKKIELYTTAVVLANVFYILRKINGNEKSKEQIKDLRLLVKILPIDESIVEVMPEFLAPFNEPSQQSSELVATQQTPPSFSPVFDNQ
jgi:predicted nucleic acid-binding protein